MDTKAIAKIKHYVTFECRIHKTTTLKRNKKIMRHLYKTECRPKLQVKLVYSKYKPNYVFVLTDD